MMAPSYPTEEIRLSQHFYVYLALIFLAVFSLFLLVVEDQILIQFRQWVSNETLNPNLLIWFALCVILALLAFFIGMMLQFFNRQYRLVYMIAYVMIFAVSLLFVTIFYDLSESQAFERLFTKLGILIIGNIVVLFLATIFYYLNFSSWYHFGVFAIGIMAATTGYNWIYLNLIGNIARI